MPLPAGVFRILVSHMTSIPLYKEGIVQRIVPMRYRRRTPALPSSTPSSAISRCWNMGIVIKIRKGVIGTFGFRTRLRYRLRYLSSFRLGQCGSKGSFVAVQLHYYTIVISQEHKAGNRVLTLSFSLASGETREYLAQQNFRYRNETSLLYLAVFYATFRW